MTESKSVALPLGDIPIYIRHEDLNLNLCKTALYLLKLCRRIYNFAFLIQLNELSPTNRNPGGHHYLFGCSFTTIGNSGDTSFLLTSIIFIRSFSGISSTLSPLLRTFSIIPISCSVNLYNIIPHLQTKINRFYSKFFFIISANSP